MENFDLEKLRIRKEETFFIDWDDLDEIIKNTYGHDFSFIREEESPNDVSHEFSIIGQEDEWGSIDDEERIEEFIKTGKTSGHMTRTLMYDLSNRNIIPKGHYVVNVCW